MTGRQLKYFNVLIDLELVTISDAEKIHDQNQLLNELDVSDMLCPASVLLQYRKRLVQIFLHAFSETFDRAGHIRVTLLTVLVRVAIIEGPLYISL